MDQERQIRFLYPPCVFIIALTSAVWNDDPNTIRALGLTLSGSTAGQTMGSVIGILFGGSAAILVLGFALGTLSLAVLRCLLRLRRWLMRFGAFLVDGPARKLIARHLGGPGDYYGEIDAFHSADFYVRVEKHLHMSDAGTNRDLGSLSPDARTLYAAVTLDHALVAQGIHDWITRRWNAFSICSSSCAGLGVAVAIVLWKHLDAGVPWWVFVLSGLLLFSHQAFVAWKETRGMIQYQLCRLSTAALAPAP